MNSRASALALGLLTLALPLRAAAEGPEEQSDFSPSYEELLLGFEDQAVDTGWIPANSPVQLRFFADAANSIAIDMPGRAYWDWRNEELRFEGSPGAGLFQYDVGLEMFASIKVDVDAIQWQSDLLGPYDWDIEALATFTPYLLEGNPDRPATLEDKTGEVDVISVPLIPDLLVLSGELDIALFIDIEASLECTRIEVEGFGGVISSFEVENEKILMDPGAGPDDLVMPATLYCHLQTWPTLVIRPHLVMTVLFTEYELAGIEIPVDLPVIDDEVAFGAIDLSFPWWESEPGDDGDGDGDGDGGGDSGEDGGGSEGSGETGDTGDAGLSGLGDEGCACASAIGEPRPLGASVLLVFGMFGIRRRRRALRGRGGHAARSPRS